MYRLSGAFLVSLLLGSFVVGRSIDLSVLRKRSMTNRIYNPLADFDATVDELSDADRKTALVADGYYIVSSEVHNGVTFDLWAQTSTPSTRRSINDIRTPNKRGTIDIQGWKCDTTCSYQTNVAKANVNDCAPAYQQLYAQVGIFTLSPTQALSASQGTCSVWIVNHDVNDITYDYWDAAGTGQWLNGYCLEQHSATVGVCQYEGIGTNTTNGVWTAVCNPSFMTG